MNTKDSPQGSKERSALHGWFLNHTFDGRPYYTMEGSPQLKTTPVGPGDRRPYPSEIAEALRQHSDARVWIGGQVLVEEDFTKPKSPVLPLPPGAYRYEHSAHPLPERLEPLRMRGDTYVRCSGEYHNIVEDLKRFLEAEGLYQQLGLTYKRGFLMYGPPGNGKTALLRDVLRSHLPQDAVILFCARVPSVRFLQGVNSTLMNRLKVFVFEELYSMISSNYCGDILGFLDGEYSTERCITFATTNYPERLPGSLINRPSRFDRYVPIGNPDEQARLAILGHLVGRAPTPQEVRETDDFSLADIREICLSSLLHNRTISASVAEHHLHRERIKRDFSERSQIGLSRS